MKRIRLHFLIPFQILINAVCGFTHAENLSDSIVSVLIDKAEEMITQEPSKAIHLANTAILKAQKIKNAGLLARSMVILGEAYINQGDFDMGFESVINALDIYPKDDLLLKADIYVSLSGAYSKLKDLEKAASYVDEAAEIYREAGDDRNLAICYNVRGLIYIHMPDNIKAEENFKKALAINRRLKEMKSVAANLNNLCLYEGNIEEKIDMLKEAIAINDSLGAVWSLSENYNNLGTQYFYGKDYEKALAALNQAAVFAGQLNAKELICDNHRYYSWVYEAMGNYSAAYNHLLELYDHEQELMAKDELRKIEVSIIQDRLREKEQEITMREQAFQIESLKQRGYILVLLIVAVLMLLLYLFYHFRQKRKIQLLEAKQMLEVKERELITLKLQQAKVQAEVVEQELEHSRHELTNFAFFIQSRKDLLSNIRQMIKDGFKLKGPVLDAHLRNVNVYLSQFDARNTEMELLIDQINEQFINKLSRLHPNLSKNERRLASLLRIGLSTKEIASVIDSTPKTVNMARYRLRKSLNLDSDESLSEYMKSI